MQPARLQLDDVFFALADGTRREILAGLARGPRTVGELAEPFPISAPAVTKHLKILERAGLVTRRVEGRQHHCSLAPRALQRADEWLGFYRDFWNSRLDELEKVLESPGNTPGDEPARATKKKRRRR